MKSEDEEWFHKHRELELYLWFEWNISLRCMTIEEGTEMKIGDSDKKET